MKIILIILAASLWLLCLLVTFGLIKEWRRHWYLMTGEKHTKFMELLVWLASFLWPVMLFIVIGHMVRDKYKFKLCFRIPKTLINNRS